MPASNSGMPWVDAQSLTSRMGSKQRPKRRWQAKAGWIRRCAAPISRSWVSFLRRDDLARFAESLRRAGLPDRRQLWALSGSCAAFSDACLTTPTRTRSVLWHEISIRVVGRAGPLRPDTSDINFLGDLESVTQVCLWR